MEICVLTVLEAGYLVAEGGMVSFWGGLFLPCRRLPSHQCSYGLCLANAHWGQEGNLFLSLLSYEATVVSRTPVKTHRMKDFKTKKLKKNKTTPRITPFFKIRSLPHTMTLFHLNYLLKALSPNTVTLSRRGSVCECGGSDSIHSTG